MSISWKTEGLPEFQRSFRRYQEVSSKDFVASLKHRVGRLGFTLFRLFNKEARRTRIRIRRTPAREMRVRTGDRTQAQEKARRIFAAGFAASGWLVAALKFRPPGASAKPLNPVSKPRGDVSLNLTGQIRSADLVNFAPGAADTDAKHGLTNKALRLESADMERYLERRANRNSRELRR